MPISLTETKLQVPFWLMTNMPEGPTKDIRFSFTTFGQELVQENRRCWNGAWDLQGHETGYATDEGNPCKRVSLIPLQSSMQFGTCESVASPV